MLLTPARPPTARFTPCVWVTIALACLIFGAGGAGATEPTGSGEIDFETRVRPLLLDHCGDCHGADTQESGLRLDVRHRALRGGDFGAVIRPGDSTGSELMQRIRSTEPKTMMPPEGQRLGAEEIDLLARWIDAGAKWPETEVDRHAAESDHDPRLDHWAWQPVARPAVPAARPGFPAGNPIDHFIAEGLAAQGLAAAPEADRRTLARRLSFDLLGLPPDPAEVDRFVADGNADAYERLVDQMLASPRYGERWARHWLDIAHYADTHGFERDQVRPDAWRYRDWVIRALNGDMPYDAFLRDQIAGDVLAPDDHDRTVATGFLAAGPWDFVGQQETQNDVLRRQARADDLDDMVTQVLAGACGATVNCARCHDHKLDPIPQREFYSLVAVFAGVRRGPRVLSESGKADADRRRTEAEAALASERSGLHRLAGRPVDLADIVGGGDGSGTGRKGHGIDPRSGQPRDKTGLQILDGVRVNVAVPGPAPLVDAVFVADGSRPVTIATTGLAVTCLPPTSGAAWDVIRAGPVAQQFSTTLGDVDYGTAGHTLIGLHANAGITFDLAAIAADFPRKAPRFSAVAGYGGRTAEADAEFHVLVDGVVSAHGRIGRDDGGVPVDVPLPPGARFLTLVATDGGNGIANDQVCFGDPRIEGLPSDADRDLESRIAAATERVDRLEKDLATFEPTPRFFGPVVSKPPEVSIHLRGNPETLGDPVTPGGLSLLAGLPRDFGDFGSGDAARRTALAAWITAPQNPLTPRVIVNRLWHHHFGTGIVDTPSDFGTGGGPPSHPELLDWLAAELPERGWSLKAMHRLICTSHTYRQRTVDVPGAAAAAGIDSGNRLLWRQNPRRLDAESLHDATLVVSGCLNETMYGPGYRDFDYKEEYSPVYSYVTPDTPDLWRRSIYRFVVRSTPHAFMTTLDCPNPASLTPARLRTTTALQSLALLNNDFMLRQADHWARRLEDEAGPATDAQVRRAFALAFARSPDKEELRAGGALIANAGLVQFCRMLLNTNEFVHVD